MQQIRVRGARTHNLKNVNVELPRDRLIVITGLSGSGKSSLAFDTLYAEGQRRYVESLSAYARQFLSMMDKPDVDAIDGLSPAIAIEQKATSHNPRSTVGTVTEIYDYLRLLYARAGIPRCPDHGIDLEAQTVSQMVDQVLKLPEGTAAALLAPLITDRKGEHVEVLEDLASQGFVRARIDGKLYEMDSLPKLDPKRKHTIEAVVDRFRVKPDSGQRLAESFETALRISEGLARLIFLDEPHRDEIMFSSRHACPVCGYSVPALEPKLFSFNSPTGACPTCDGLGVKEFFDPARVVTNPDLSLAGGAIRGWDRRNAYYFQLIQSLAKHYDFDIETPWNELPAKVQKVVLYGSGEQLIEFRYTEGKGKTTRKKHVFEGILPNLERRYRETESTTVREELAKYLGLQPCPECKGARLNRAARFVFVAERPLPEVAHLTVGRALEFFRGLNLAGWRGEVATKIVKDVADRLRFLVDVGLDYLTLDRSAESLSGGLARLIFLDEPAREELVFSSRHACPVCGYSVPALEPKLFSFNSPTGACPTCDGLGVKEFFDPARVVTNPDLSLAGGAIRGWDRRNAYYFQLIQSLAKHYDFDIETPWNELPAKVQKVVLYGSGEQLIEFRYTEGKGKTTRKKHVFEGILPNLERRYRETESTTVREELAKYLGLQPCPECKGARLNRAARFVFVAERPLPEVAHLTVGRALEFFRGLNLAGWRGEVATKIVKDVADRLRFLVDVGLDYLTLDRSAESLSGGEAQRIRLASQVGSGLTGVMYILDEPSIGLHQRDNRRLLETLKHLRDIGNTVIVVEHDEDAILAADHVLDMGPGAGVHGGEVVAQGTPKEIEASAASLTGQYLSGRKEIPLPAKLTPRDPDKVLKIVDASANNLQHLTAEIPLGLLTCVTGVSGSGKSTLIIDTLFNYANSYVNGTMLTPTKVERVEGLQQIDRIIDIDQSPIGRTPRSNPATYTGLFAPLRDLFSAVPEARARGYDAGRFSFNVKGGRCEACQGDGVIKVEMHFLPDVYVPCDVCRGQRYNRETLEIRYRGKNIYEVLEMTVEEALRFFQAVPMLASKLQTLVDVGLSYVRLGQNATTLSGGEAQRVKLARELAKRATGRTLYILDEPTTGLHFHDVAQLLEVLHRLRDEGNTIVVIEHNLDVIKTADWLIDLGPEGGEGGGTIVGTGTPAQLAANPKSYTGQYLKPLLDRQLRTTRKGKAAAG